MPGMNGPQTLVKMRQIPGLANVPAIFMTARAQNSDIEKLHNQGATAVICKPFDPISLGSQIKALLEQASHPRKGDASTKQSMEDVHPHCVK